MSTRKRLESRETTARLAGTAAAVALGSILALAAGACRGGDAGPQRHTIIDSRDTYDPRSLDPAHANDIPSGRLVAYLYDGLLRFAPDGSLKPDLATRWETSADGRTYTFHLRQGVKFHDGTPFSAGAVVHSFARALAPDTHGVPLWPLLPIAGAREFAAGTASQLSGVTAQDDSTVTIALAEPLAVFPKLLAMPVASIVPPSVPPGDGNALSEHPIGTGPWRLASWKHDDYVRLARNDAYFDGAPKIDSLEARIIPEKSTAVAEFESGNVDVLYIPEAETRDWVQTDEKKALIQSTPPLRLWYVAINTTHGPLADARVRRAMNEAIDRRTILDQMLSGRGTLAAGVVPPSLEGADSTRRAYSYDPADAKRLLAAAGHRGGIDVELWVSQEPPWPRLAETLQGYLQAVGIRARIVQRDASSMREAARNGKTDLVLKDWYADYPDAENFLYPLLHSANVGVGGNVSFYANPEFDRLVSAARRQTDEARRTTLYRQADEIQFHDAPMVYLFFYNELYAVQPWITGFQVPVVFNAQRWTDVKFGGNPGSQ
jgi:ABC-type transport system substrate-binding protein